MADLDGQEGDDPHGSVTSMQNENERNLQARNLRTGLTMASIAAVFFIGVFVARTIGTDEGGLTVLGMLVVGFLVVAIGRNLRSRQ